VTTEHEVSVIDREPSACAALDDELGSISVVGDGTDPGVLSKAGANRADVLVATTRSDSDNLVACQLAKHRFGAARTISVVSISDHERLFNMLGIDVTINTTELIVGKIQEESLKILVEEVGSLG